MDYMLLAGGRTELHYCQYHDMSLGGRRLFAACGVPPDYHPTITITFIMRSVCGPPHKTSRRAAEDSCGDGESDGGVCRGLVGSVHSRRTTNDERQWGNGPHTKHHEPGERRQPDGPGPLGLHAKTVSNCFEVTLTPEAPTTTTHPQSDTLLLS
jgi:hypothetical protein